MPSHAALAEDSSSQLVLEDVLVGTGLAAAHPDRPPVLTDVTLALRSRQRLAILGANGTGKTTLLRLLAGAHRPLAGRIECCGEVLNHDRAGLRKHRRRVQLVLQDPDDQLFSADVTQDVSFGPMNMGLAEAEVQQRVSEALQLLGCDQLAHRPTHQLSYGERKRVAVAGAVAMRPQVLLLDEPTAGMDPSGVRMMVAALERVRGLGTTIALATHDVALALAWADAVAIVCEGVAHTGAPEVLLADADLIERAHLEMPWPLALATALNLPGSPRTLHDVVSLWKEKH